MGAFIAFLRILTVLLVLVPTPVFAEESKFFSALNDVPLMPGLYELTDETVVFDKPEGRIVESSAVSETQNVNKIKGFYAQTLPQLGWQRQAVPQNAGKAAIGADSYVREGETLTLKTETRHQLNIVRFSLSPNP